MITDADKAALDSRHALEMEIAQYEKAKREKMRDAAIAKTWGDPAKSLKVLLERLESETLEGALSELVYYEECATWCENNR